MTRLGRRKQMTWGGRVVRFVLLKALPLAVSCAVVWLVHTGRVDTSAFPPAAVKNAVAALAMIAVLIITASIALPVVHGIARSLRIQLAYSREIRGRAGILRRMWELLLWPFRAVFHLVFSLCRFVLIVANLALILATVVFMVRIFSHDFLERWVPLGDWHEHVVAWIEGRF